MRLKTQEEFINQLKLLNKSYILDKVVYINDFTPVILTCPIHNDFSALPTNLLKGHGCRKCANDMNKKTKEQFIMKANNIHNNKYDYSSVEYIRSDIKVKIICHKHGMFEQTPKAHTYIKRPASCPHCRESKGELQIRNFLIENNVDYIRNKKFESCKHMRYLPFDFYLPKYNICIEYDGIQHFQPIEFFGGEKQYVYRMNNDNIKTKWCQDNNIKLIRIKYDCIAEKLEIINNIISS